MYPAHDDECTYLVALQSPLVQRVHDLHNSLHCDGIMLLHWCQALCVLQVHTGTAYVSPFSYRTMQVYGVPEACANCEAGDFPIGYCMVTVNAPDVSVHEQQLYTQRSPTTLTHISPTVVHRSHQQLYTDLTKSTPISPTVLHPFHRQLYTHLTDSAYLACSSSRISQTDCTVSRRPEYRSTTAAIHK